MEESVLGGAPAADSSNSLYLMRGNGIFDGQTAWGDIFLKFRHYQRLTVTDFFTPSNQLTLDAADLDLGSGGTAVLVDQSSGPHPHLLVVGSKNGLLFVLVRTNMGKFTSAGADQVVQTISGRNLFSTPYSGRTHYSLLDSLHLEWRSLFLPTLTRFNPVPVSQTAASFSFPGSSPSISSSGSSNGIVSTIDSHTFGTSNAGSVSAGPVILHAFDQRIWGTNCGTAR